LAAIHLIFLTGARRFNNRDGRQAGVCEIAQPCCSGESKYHPREFDKSRQKQNFPHDGSERRAPGSHGMTHPDADINALFTAHRANLLRYLKMRLRNQEEAEEVLQEAFMRFVKARETTEVENDYALLVRICSNQAVDRIRANASRKNREKSWGDQYYRSRSDDDVIGSSYASQERQVAAREDLKRVMEVLDGFSETLRTAFILHRFEGLALKEVAARMNLAQSTVEKHIMKVSRHLIQRFKRP
jgi:RNA polymerase sigma factor (sigma-70 family)